jgi:hypothetical protein
MPPQIQNEFIADLRIVQTAVKSGVSHGRSVKGNKTWHLWLGFCADLGIDPTFANNPDPIPILQVFAQRYRDGRIAPRGKPVRSGTVSDAIRMVGQSYRSMGAPDHRLDHHGKIDFRLIRQLQSYTNQDPPSYRVKPVPIQLVSNIVEQAYTASLPAVQFQATADMICLAFFFLLRPGEYTVSPNNTPFKFQDVKLFIGQRLLCFDHLAAHDLHAVTSVALKFTTQKNGQKGEVITHGRSNDQWTCPVKALVRRIQHLLRHNQPPTTPLGTYIDANHNVRTVNPSDITQALRKGLVSMGPDTFDINPGDISARSLRAGGATALLCANIDHDTIQLLGRWKSDAMIRYLHISANPAIQRYAHLMFVHGAASFRPGLVAPIRD